MASASSAFAPPMTAPGEEFGYGWAPSTWTMLPGKAGTSSVRDDAVLGGTILCTEDAKLQRPKMAKWSPSGTLLATASNEIKARVCKLLPDGSLGHWGVLTGHSEPVHAVAWSPRSRGTVCFTAGRDSSLRIWDLAAGKALANLVTRPNVIHMAASQDGNYFSASTTDDVISVYDARTNKLMSSTLVPFETNSQEWTAAGHLDVACGKKGSEGGMLVRFSVNAAAPQPRQVSAPVAEALSSSSLAAATSRAVPPKQAVVTSLGGAGCGLTKVAEVPVLAGAARVLSRSLDGALVALAGVDSSVVLLDAATDTCVRSVDAGSGAVTSVDFSRDGCHLAVASRDSPIRIVRLCDGTTVREIAGTAARYVTAAWHPTKDLLAVISDDGTSPTKLRVLKC